MFKYEGVKCPVCSSYLMDDDDIVVCPDCGAPHHRDCWNYLGHCGCEELHQKGETWQAPQPERQTHVHTDQTGPSSGASVLVCPACRTQNPPNTLFCTHCGNPLMKTESNPFQSPFGNVPGGPMGGFGFAPGTPGVVDPLGGLSAEDDIDGISAKDLAAVVGQNSAYYLPRFKMLQEHPEKKIPNFSAFIFCVPWLFFRRMVLPGILFLLANAALYLPNILMLVFAVQNPDAAQLPSGYMWANMLCTLLMWVLQLLLCFFGNRLYMRHCLKIAKDLKGVSSSDAEFAELAQKRGGVRPAFIYLFIGLYLASSLATFFLL